MDFLSFCGLLPPVARGSRGAPLAPQAGSGAEPHRSGKGSGERFKLPSGVWGGAPATKAFWCILERILCISELSEVTNYSSATSLL